MEKRIGLVAVLVKEREQHTVTRLNEILARYHDLIMARQGLPIHSKGIHLISLVVEGTSDEIGALSGQIGRLPGIAVKSVLTPQIEGEGRDDHDSNSP
ncbi:MAG: CopG family transcriptional regulator [Spirochaetales bacterium]|nr:CopG family transcriptional regulator [Spirochaetales bacterium]